MRKLSGTDLYLGILVLFFYAAILLTGDIQEDAYITFRTAFNHMKYGEMSFNVGEKYSGATSLIYPYLVSFVGLIFGEAAIWVLLVINATTVAASAYFFSRIAIKIFNFNFSFLTIWFCIALMPVSLLMAVRAMEAPYVVLLFILGIYGLLVNNWGMFYISLGALVFVRPDAVAFGFILIACVYLKENWQRTLSAIGVLFFGIILYLFINKYINDSWLPVTMMAKNIEAGNRSAQVIFGKLFEILFLSGTFSPLPGSKYTSGLSAVFSIFYFFGLIWIINISAKNGVAWLVTPLASASLLIPCAYAIRGVVFPWYTWPIQFFIQGLYVVFLLSYAKYRNINYSTNKVVLLFYVVAIALMQLILSYSKGYQESGYRASVGKYLRSISNSSDSLFLEPAGYIPYYAELRTIDEVGLASRTVLKYKISNGQKWWIATLKGERPTYLVQRSHILINKTYQGNDITQDESQWIMDNYDVVKHFKYDAYLGNNIGFLGKLRKLGTTEDYIVFKLKPQQPPAKASEMRLRPAD